MIAMNGDEKKIIREAKEILEKELKKIEEEE